MPNLMKFLTFSIAHKNGTHGIKGARKQGSKEARKQTLKTKRGQPENIPLVSFIPYCPLPLSLFPSIPSLSLPPPMLSPTSSPSCGPSLPSPPLHLKADPHLPVLHPTRPVLPTPTSYKNIPSNNSLYELFRVGFFISSGRGAGGLRAD